MSELQDHYRVLGLPRGVPAEDIKRAYRALVRKAHPDVNPGDPGAELRFKQIRSAYDVLSDPIQRERYDRGEGDFVFRDFAPAPPARRGSIFATLVQVLFGGRRGRGIDLHAQVVLDFTDAVIGSTVDLVVRRGGSREAEERIRVRIPPGVEDGATVRVKGKGRLGHPPGDLLVNIRAQPHDQLTRVGPDIHLVASVPIWDAALGTALPVVTVEGRATIRISPGTQSGRKIRLRGLGVPSRSGVGRGDQIVEIRVRTPVITDERSRSLLRQLALLQEAEAEEAASLPDQEESA